MCSHYHQSMLTAMLSTTITYVAVLVQNHSPIVFLSNNIHAHYHHSLPAAPLNTLCTVLSLNITSWWSYCRPLHCHCDTLTAMLSTSIIYLVVLLQTPLLSLWHIDCHAHLPACNTVNNIQTHWLPGSPPPSPTCSSPTAGILIFCLCSQ